MYKSRIVTISKASINQFMGMDYRFESKKSKNASLISFSDPSKYIFIIRLTCCDDSRLIR